MEYFVHESAAVDEDASIGAGTRIWHYSHVQGGATIGEGCGLGQNVNIGNDVAIGNRVKIQDNVSVYTGTVVEGYVFLGPSCVLTNVTNPSSEVNRHALYERTLLRRGCTIGANATVVCGVTIGRDGSASARGRTGSNAVPRRGRRRQLGVRQCVQRGMVRLERDHGATAERRRRGPRLQSSGHGNRSLLLRAPAALPRGAAGAGGDRHPDRR